MSATNEPSEGTEKVLAYAPILNEAQIDRIRVFAKPRQVAAGEILYNPGDDTPPVYIVISGAIKIVVHRRTRRADGYDLYRSGQFSGELLMISGRSSIYRCQAVEAGTLLELSARDLRTLIARMPELGEIFMNAFLTRRLSLKETGQGNVVVLGSRYSADALRAEGISDPRRTSLHLFRSTPTRRRRNCLTDLVVHRRHPGGDLQ